jgi:hypothetical protein
MTTRARNGRTLVRWARALGAAACTAAVALLAACVGPPLVPPQDAGSVTGGLGMNLWYAQVKTRQYQYFEVRAEGTLAYGGGMVAFDRRTEWTGRLSPEQGRAFREAVDRAGWMTATNPASGEGDDEIAEITLFADGASRAFTIRGADAQVAELVKSLQAIANSRFRRELDALPQPGLQPR